MKPDSCQLWNPKAAALWSLLFSPAFGAWVHAANWRVLGRPDKALAARRWSYLMVGTVLLAGVAGALFESHARHLPSLATAAWMAVWCCFPAREQCRYVAKNMGGDYRRGPWWPALLGGIAGWLLLALLSLGAATLLVRAGGFYI